MLDGKGTLKKVLCLYLYKSVIDRLKGSVTRLRISDSEV